MTPFGVRQFLRLLAASLAVNVLSFINVSVGNILAGRFLGEEALSGVALASPFLTFGNFLISLVGAGTGIVYSLRRGRLDRDGAESGFMQGVWTALVFGVFFGLLVWLLREPYFQIVNPAAAALVHAREYWTYFPFGLAMLPLSAVFLNCCWCDGDSRLATIAYAGQCILSFAVPYFLLRGGFGAGACAIGFVVGQLSLLVVLVGHFFRPSNTFTFRWRFRLPDTLAIVKSSAGDALGFFGDALVYVVLGVVISRAYGQAALIYFPVFVFVTELLSYASGFAAAMQPIVAVYYGEGNHRSVRIVVRKVFSYLIMLSLLITVLLFCFPSLVLWMLGIDSPGLIDGGCAVVRWSALMILPLTVMNTLNNYYQFIEHEGVSVGMTVFYWFFMPVATILLFAMLAADSFWCWCSAARWGGVVLFALFLLVRFTRRRFPFILDPEREAAITVYDLVLEEKDIAYTAESVAKRLEEFGVKHDRAMRARLLVEETLMVVKDRNEGKRVYAEVTIDLNDGVRITLRDDGEIFDITDADAKVNGLRTYLVATMMERQEDKVNILTTGFNRNVFRL